METQTMTDVTQILSQIENGDPNATEQLLPLVYHELRKLAAAKMARELPDHTLQATALVHEAYVRLVDTDRVQHWNSRGHFFGAAAEAMRRILVERARKGSVKAGRPARLLEDVLMAPLSLDAGDLLALDEALAQLEQTDLLAARLVKLRFFAGLTMPQTAEAMGIPLRTAERNWTYARTWLHRQLRPDG
jgi:RNA polymerase sigma factor (TIGR02999 family)